MTASQSAAPQTFGVGGGISGFGFIPRQFGGEARANQDYLVGEDGPELFRPKVSGSIIPNQTLMAQPFLPSAGNISNADNRRIIESLNVAEDMFNDPVALAKLQNLIKQAILETL